MIDLRLKVDPLPLAEPLVLRLCEHERPDPSEHDACLIRREADCREYEYLGFSVRVHASEDMPLDGDVLMIVPGQASAHRLVRASSKHNTLLVTEQCDQLCVMCSQPPKKHHIDLFDQFAVAAKLAPFGAYIGISGGEPLLHKDRLFDFLASATVARPDLNFHILTNAQHFVTEDLQRMDEIGLERLLWGIPLYASDPDLHDEIVGKPGAFNRLERSLSFLMRAGASVELRTVVTKQNWANLRSLSNYVVHRTPFISVWALMQLERIGFGRMNWHKTFQDTSADFTMLKAAINLASARGIAVSLYNFPQCSVPETYRQLAPSTISDWKRKYLDFCDGCSARATCGGFFEWYSHSEGFNRLGPI
ncbi:His-Xaa-Ser system radical SAM maturase HxsC [Sinorhizobium kummerowiae]|uniref:His-Xaa-Ser system radical SAM maturase HxsC n=1 Tax=Sinorhizobium kummerowiae TaxID=158892 RepID=A0ABY8T8K3_9HYPH|nr:His-Xaa-Ser system radical SAM maturase HxsC [Sinorhizobium kummerowiae]WHS94229.1 His-Xaa-Ser system radical SAM maturase HxsC [Sinorhizobium kummerowiae]WRW46157.1 His-Xaa-Ser system radical SAM maturase HxsC [Sinorhizobium kummerowiae]